MAKVLLGDVIDHIKDKINKDTSDLEYYVGGEHIDGDEIMVHRKGLIHGSTIGPAFHMRFRQGDVLLMSRNPHLRKASMVDFDGICSDVSYVCRTKDNGVLLQSLLPFIMQTPEFWQFAEENKKGGLPFFLNWKDFARFEFELIPIDRQQQISDLLWTIERVKDAYRNLIARTDDLVKARFVEMFGDPALNPNLHPMKKLSKLGVLNRGVSKARPRNKPELLGGQYPLVQTGEVSAAKLYIDHYENTYSEEGLAQSKMWPKGTLCITIAANIAQTGILSFDACFPDSVCGFISNDEVTQIYMHYWFSFFQKVLEEQAPQMAQRNINLKILNDLDVMVPPHSQQQAFDAFAQQVDKSKIAVQQTLQELTEAQRALMKKIFV